MKKVFLSTLLLLSFQYAAFSGDKVKLGIKVSPVVSYASVKDNKSDDFSFSSNGSTLKIVIGPYADFLINDNVSFTTGLWFSPRTVKLTLKYTEPLTKVQSSASSQYNLQYLMVPVFFKFNTNEVSDGLKIYFTLGGTVDFKIAEKYVGDDNIHLKDVIAEKEDKALFSYIDASLLAGAGVEYELGDVTTLYAGISYNRGLVNILNPFLSYKIGDETIKPYQQLSIKNNLIGLDLGIKF